MAWLHVPSTVCPSAPEAADSNSACASPNLDIALCVTLSGKATLRPLSWRGWQTRPWIKLLSGTTLPPSTAALGVASRISSLRDTPASHLVPPGGGSAPTIPGISGPTSLASSESAAPPPSSSKTFPTIYVWDSARSSMSWDRWVIALRRDSLLRRKSARAMSACACLPWPTPRTFDAEQRGTINLGPSSSHTLGNAAAMWPTPKASSGGANSKLQERGAGGPDLVETVQSWPSPAARDWRSPNSRSSQERRNVQSRRGQQLPNFVEHCFPSLPPAPIPPSGRASSTSTRRLNPRFVEWLMGWPIGWTDCGSAVTGLSLWLARSRTVLSALLSRPAIEPNGQLLLFGEPLNDPAPPQSQLG